MIPMLSWSRYRPSGYMSAVALGLAAMLTAGCALLATPDPVQLYRFGGDVPSAGQTRSAAPVQLQLRRVEFPEASRGDKLLGVTGAEAAYIKGARWVSPAEDLYSAGVEGAFAAQSTGIRLIGRRELTPATRLLDIDVLTFEARYDYVDALPTVVVSARARVLRYPERTVAAEQTFTVSQPASANRVSAIVEAFDLATRDLNTQIVGWTDGVVSG